MAPPLGAHVSTRPGRSRAAFIAAAMVAALLAAAPGPAPPAAADGNEAPGNPVAFGSLTAGEGHTCAITASHAVKCWGRNEYGELGLGDTASRGDQAGEMGDANLPSVSLGAGRTATAITAGGVHTCALLDNGTVKCWGNNASGQLGVGDTARRGDQPGEMGDNLPTVNLGTGRTATAITAGTAHTCALLDNGTVKCWGHNANGRLGLGDTTNRGDGPGEMGDNLPTVNLGTGRTATAITAYEHTCALLDNHTVKCWGNNASGQLGVGDTARRGDQPGEMGDNLPTVNLGTGRTATAITAGAEHTCALLDDHTVKCWGYNARAQLGMGDTATREDGPGEMGDNLPAVDLGTGRTATAITGGGYFTCALLDNGAIKCWGSNGRGQLGVGDANLRGYQPGEMGDNLPAVNLGTLRTAIAVTTGYDHACALLDDGTLKCWGANAYGELGQGDNADRGDQPLEMGDHLLAVAVDDSVSARLYVTAAPVWGRPGTTLEIAVEVHNTGGVTITGLMAGPDCAPLPAVLTPGAHAPTTCQRAVSGSDAPTVDHLIEVSSDQVPSAATTATLNVERVHPQRSIDLDAGGLHTCIVTDNGTVRCWGEASSGQLGLGDTADRGDGTGAMGEDLPTVDLGTGRTATAITACEYHTCAILDDGTVKCWGNNHSERLGLGLGSILRRGDQPGEMGDNLPAVNLGTGRTATAIAAGWNHTCAILENGTVKCWGENSGLLGLGDTANRGDQPAEMGDHLPAVDLGVGRTATAITAGYDHTCAVLDDGTVKCWGWNDYGQLGMGDTIWRGDGPGEMGDHLPAVDLGPGRTAIAVTAGRHHTCAILDNHTVKCWGVNQYGQLGLGVHSEILRPGDQPGEMGVNLPTLELGAGRTATAIAAGEEHTCALLDNGSIKCWGYNADGRLGVGDLANRGDGPGEMGDYLPAVDLGTGRTATTIAAGTQNGRGHTCTLLDDGTVKCWGDNAHGQVGLGDTNDRGDEPGEMGDALPIVDLGDEGPAIGGRVVDAVSGDPVAHGWVAVLDAGDYHPVGAAYTTADGTFATTIDPGTYRLYVIDPTGDHTPGLHPTVVTVNPEALTGTQITMAPTRGAIAGSVTTANTTTPIDGAVVLALNAANGTPGPFTTTNPDGTYTLNGLGPTPQRIVTLDPTGNHQPQFHHNTPFPLDATIVTSSPGTTTTINLDPPTATAPTGGATLTGTLTTDGQPGSTIAGGLVIALHSSNLAYAAATIAGPDGHYTLNLDPGTYRIAALDPTSEHQAEWHPDHPLADLPGAPTNTLNPGPNTIDIALAPLTGNIAGTITDTTNQPIHQAWVIAVASNGAPSGYATTRHDGTNDGTYTIGGLPPGTYRLTIADPHHNRPQQWWNQQPTYAAATPITITPATTHTANATLPNP